MKRSFSRPPVKGGSEPAGERGVGLIRGAKDQAIGVIGLGTMGSAMAASLAKAGCRVHGYDIVAARRAALKKAGGTPQASISRVARAAEVLITSLPSAGALHAVAAELGAKGRVVMETSTLPIDEKERARVTLAKKGVVLLDCPLSGTGAQARAKDLVVYASGDKRAYARAEPFMPGFSRAHHYLGAFGNGSKMKFVANLLVAIHNVSAAEAFVLGMKAGLAPRTILRVAGDGAGASRMFQVRGPMMVAGRYRKATMKNEVWQKDLKIIRAFARALGVRTPVFDASATVYAAAMQRGYAQQDTAAVCAVLEAMAGLKRQRRKT